LSQQTDASASAAETETEAEDVATYEKIDGISSPAVLEKYDTFLLDMWGGTSK